MNARTASPKTRCCPKCRRRKLIKYFWKNRAQRNGLAVNCKACTEEYRLIHTDRYAAQRRSNHLKKKYGIDQKRFDAILRHQNNVCACCSNVPATPDSRQRRYLHGWHVDHDHKTGRLRGIVCQQCNNTLARLGDHLSEVIASTSRFINYLRRSAKKQQRARERTNT